MGTSKKLWVLLLVMALIASLAAGCTQSATPEATATDGTQNATGDVAGEDANLTPWGLDKSEYYLISIMGTPDDAWEKFSETLVGQAILDKFNIDFEYVAHTGSNVEKQQLLLAGGDYYEIQYMETATIRQAYMDADALVSLDTYLDKMPNFTTLFTDSIPYYKAAAADGQLYYWQANSFPVKIPEALSNKHGFLVRADALMLYADKYGYDNPPVYLNDYAELIQMAIDAELTDVNGNEAVGLTVSLGEPWDLELGMFENNGSSYVNDSRSMVYSYEDESWIPILESPVAKEQYQFFNKLYNNGLLDEECFTDLYDQTVDKVKIASAIAVYYETWLEAEANQYIAESGHPEMQYVDMPRVSAVSGPLQDKMLLAPVLPTNDFSNYAITKNVKYPERIAELIEYLSSDEGAILNFNGIEGVNWQVNDEGQREFIDEDYVRRTDANSPNYDATYESMTGINGFDKMIGMSQIVNAADGEPQQIVQSKAHIAKWMDMDYMPNIIREKYGWASSGTYLEDKTSIFTSDVPYGISLETGSEYDIINQDIVEIRLHNTYSVITAEDFDAAFQAMMDEFHASDYQVVVDEFNRLSDEIIASAKGN